MLSPQHRLLLFKMEQRDLRVLTQIPRAPRHVDLTSTVDDWRSRFPGARLGGLPIGTSATGSWIGGPAIVHFGGSSPTWKATLRQHIQLENDIRIILELLMEDQECHADSFYALMSFSVKQAL